MKNKLHVLASFFILSSCSTQAPTSNSSLEQKAFKIKNSTQETIINTTLTGNAKPSIAMNRTNGNFIVVWQHNNGTDNDIFAQRFNSNGTPNGSEFIVNNDTIDEQINPRVAMDDSGRFVIVWEGVDLDQGGIYAKLYDANASVVKSDYLVHNYTGDQANPSVDIDKSNGSFVVAYDNNDGNNGIYYINAKKYSRLGNLYHSTTHHLSVGNSNNRYSSVSIASLGDYAITWQENFNNVYVDRFESNGSSKWVTAQKVNTSNTANLNSFLPEVSLDTGYPLVSWVSVGSTSNSDIYGRKVMQPSDMPTYI